MKLSSINIGTSGFCYKDWLGNFYPQFCPQPDFLQFYASRFATVEIDSTFYRIPTVETVTKWARLTPDNFVFAAKFPQSVTHKGELNDRLADSAQFLKVMSALGTKQGPLLLQFPYSFKPDQEGLLLRLMASMPDRVRIAVELRNKKWLDNTVVFDRMREKNIAFCQIDHPWMPRVETETADFAYLRFLGDRNQIDNDFSYVRFGREEELAWWRDLIDRVAGEGKDLYAYFNNHYSGHAPSTAFRLMEMLGLVA